MVSAAQVLPVSHREAYQLAVDARDRRFDGVFFVAITTTRVYCRPICPSRLAYDRHRRFFDSAAAAERAGFRPCLRCRPELAPGTGRVGLAAVSRLAQLATQRIAAGALNDRSVSELAGELGVSERHLRRALEREVGVSPLDLAQTHRLLLAKRLLADTDLPVTRVAYASGFQSLRRFNASFREQYGMPPSALRRKTTAPAPRSESLQITLAYRPPLAWDALLDSLRAVAMPGVEVFEGREGRRYGRTVRIGEHKGFVFASDAPGDHLTLEVSASLLPVLMPLIAGMRRLFDLDAEPSVVDAHLAQGGLDTLVASQPGVRVPGALDGFEVALQLLLGSRGPFGEQFDTGVPGLTHLAPTPEQIVEAGVPPRLAATVTALARAVTTGAIRLEPGSDVEATRRTLIDLGGIGARLAMQIVMRALYWPDAFYTRDRALLARAEAWRPWRAYAALQLVPRRDLAALDTRQDT